MKARIIYMQRKSGTSGAFCLLCFTVHTALFTGYLPYDGRELKRDWETDYAVFKKILDACLSWDPKRRPTALELVELLDAQSPSQAAEAELL